MRRAGGTAPVSVYGVLVGNTKKTTLIRSHLSAMRQAKDALDRSR